MNAVDFIRNGNEIDCRQAIDIEALVNKLQKRLLDSMSNQMEGVIEDMKIHIDHKLYEVYEASAIDHNKIDGTIKTALRDITNTNHNKNGLKQIQRKSTMGRQKRQIVSPIYNDDYSRNNDPGDRKELVGSFAKIISRFTLVISQLIKLIDSKRRIKIQQFLKEYVLKKQNIYYRLSSCGVYEDRATNIASDELTACEDLLNSIASILS